MGSVSTLSAPEAALRDRIIREMARVGFSMDSRLQPPDDDRQTYRRIQQNAKLSQVREHAKLIRRALPLAKEHFPDPKSIVPDDIELKLIPVECGTIYGNLFLWWNLVWWSMPYQRAYGRQMRFMIWDVTHNAPFGLIQLQSPLLRMAARDTYLNIPKGTEDRWANASMSAGRIGALPPYNGLIGGKMAALAVTSNEVRAAYRSKYAGRKTVMNGRTLDPDLLFITTTSAFGRSSMYDRLRYGGELAAVRIGSTTGHGTFHVPEHLVREMYAMLRGAGVDTSTTYGHGPSRKVKLLKAAFARLGLRGYHGHGLRRDVYLFPLASNLKSVIRDGGEPEHVDRPFADIVRYWKERWAVPRSVRMPEWREFDGDALFRDAAGTVNSG